MGGTTVREPQDYAAEIESAASPPEGPEERFSGYAVIGLPFASGHILALRRFPASSVGPGYTSVWHRDPEGHWTFYQDVTPEQGCFRYFGSALDNTVMSPIRVEWTGPRSFSIRIDGERGVQWDLTLAATPVTRALNALGARLPASWWRKEPVLAVMAAAARFSVGAGKLNLYGRTPNGQTFQALPRYIWLIQSSRAAVQGQDLGPLGPVAGEVRLGDFLVPRRGLFAIASAYLKALDPLRHSLSRVRATL
jgi:hypothetical protein